MYTIPWGWVIVVAFGVQLYALRSAMYSYTGYMCRSWVAMVFDYQLSIVCNQHCLLYMAILRLGSSSVLA